MSTEELRKAVERLEFRLRGVWEPQADVHADWQTIRARLVELEAENERLRRALDRSSCYHRCSRIHPHCQLKIARIGAPDHLWFWTVSMPDGHIFATSGAGKSFDTLDDCMADAQTSGREWLEKADAVWRESHPRITAHLGAEHG